ncbi:hypothetical protein DCC39_05440 [Pueribacillus theae]|uniref:Uncharacterized protein n=1 Tax=Pueribacillus theae TaxID=2171751 RepID=A0A2U1K5L1_9BACI|nr:hypothetical protein DCC39_05440 [Pueribacillus theae]
MSRQYLLFYTIGDIYICRLNVESTIIQQKPIEIVELFGVAKCDKIVSFSPLLPNKKSRKTTGQAYAST